MKRNISEWEFADAFRDMGRGDNFSYAGLRALYDYLIQYEEDCGEEIELDVIGLCCDYSEYDTALEAAKEYGFKIEDDEDMTADEVEEVALEWLNDSTSVIVFDNGVIIQGF